MRTFIIKAGDEKTFKDLGNYLRELGNQDKTKGKDFCVVVKQNKPIRSLKANGYYHIILTIIGAETGHTHEQLHDICKKKFNYEVINLPKSGSEIRGRSTKDLLTDEFAAYVNRVKQWAQDEFGIQIPERESIDYSTQVEIGNRYDKVHSGW